MPTLTDKDIQILKQVAFKAAVDAAVVDASISGDGFDTDAFEKYTSYFNEQLFGLINSTGGLEAATASVVAAFPGATVTAISEAPSAAAVPAPVPGARPISADSSDDELWQDVITNRKDWWDNRNDKRNPKAPDFKHKTIVKGKYPVGLWFDRAPAWAKEALS
jgi:hypothetical protein